MANYNLVINSRFRPFSFQEMLAPWQLYREAYKETEDAYGALGAQAGTVESMLNKDLDTEAYAQYQGYMKGIEDAANTLAMQGLNPTLRTSINKYRTDYMNNIMPIQQAAERRKALAEEQRKLGPNYAFEYDASTTGLDKFMNNPTFTPKQINLAEIRQRSAAEFGTLAKQLRNFKENPNMYRKGFDSTVLAEYGYSPEDAARVAESIRRGEVSPEDAAASAIYNSIYGSTGVDSWSNNLNTGQQAVRNAIAEGVVGAIGQMAPQIVTDKLAYENYQQQNRIALENLRYQHELDNLREKANIAGNKGGQEGDEVGLNSRSYLQATGKEAVYNRLMTNLVQKDDLTGKVKLNKEVFGEEYGVDPMKVYEALQEAGDDIYNEMEFTEDEAKEYQARIKPYQSQLAHAEGPQKKALQNSINSIRNQMMKKKLPEYIASKYGVSRVLTKDEYDMLKDIQYEYSKPDALSEPNDVGNPDELFNSLDKTANTRTVWSTSMSDYEIPSRMIISNLAGARGTKNVAYEINPDGTKGKLRSYKEMNLKDETNKEGREITDIAYSDMYPGYIVLTVGSGNYYLVNPNALGSNYEEALNGWRYMLQDESPRDRSIAITKALAKMLNNYNPVKSKTKSGI